MGKTILTRQIITYIVQNQLKAQPLCTAKLALCILFRSLAALVTMYVSDFEDNAEKSLVKVVEMPNDLRKANDCEEKDKKENEKLSEVHLKQRSDDDLLEVSMTLSIKWMLAI
eukprot:gnl/MRDRNA2_/MRDRNA2_234304_c0_seq1.p1 gnl/MRDRNA2_/MRDRNA2_234304_c0~~gnl/MRDRNA2_/MRDRNA2_234304_c0_seq1.p1  ORF type:complete len:113 (-),score=24.74 gnl/MRDRNA2_/MRDRNA2_234304_c0_seq1:280-618(-)